MGGPYVLVITYPGGAVQTVTFTSALSRSLLIVAMAAHPVTMTLEDPS